jgi:hypothetical protein
MSMALNDFAKAACSYFLQKWRVRSGQLTRDHRNFSHSRLRRQSNRCGCISQFYRCGSANPVEFGSECGR